MRPNTGRIYMEIVEMKTGYNANRNRLKWSKKLTLAYGGQGLSARNARKLRVVAIAEKEAQAKATRELKKWVLNKWVEGRRFTLNLDGPSNI